MQRSHNPKVLAMADGRWLVVCPECDAVAYRLERPIGIRMPLQSRQTAERLRRNHGDMTLEAGPSYPWPAVET
jgi:hypothetical protein